MSRKSREILKGYFETGDKPTEVEFEDLIDSCLNLGEDGISVSETSSNIGIGIQNPQARLHVMGETNVSPREASGFFILGEVSGRHIAMDNKQIMGKGSATTTDDIYLQANGGNVAIGIEPTTLAENAPKAQLHIRGDVDPTIKIQSNGNYEISGRLALRQSNESGVDIYYDGTSDMEGLRVDRRLGHIVEPTSLFVSNRSGTRGNIGIGTTNPEHTLQIGDGTSPVSLSLRGSDDSSEASVVAFESSSGTNDGWFKLVHDTDSKELKVTSAKMEIPVLTFEQETGNIHLGGHETHLVGVVVPTPTGDSYQHLFYFHDSQVLSFYDSFMGRNVVVADGCSLHAEQLYANQKHFLIKHPLDPGRQQLVHSTLEGPEVAVFYRGEAQLSDGKATVRLPEYFDALTRQEHRTVLLTPKFDADASISMLAASEVKGNTFDVKMIDDKNPSQKFYWEVKAVRADVGILNVERAKA